VEVHGTDGDRDGQVDVQHARLQALPGALEEGLGAVEGGGRADDEHRPAEEGAVALLHAREPTGVDGGGEEHDVHGAEGGHAEANEQVLAGRGGCVEGAGLVAEGGDALGDLREGDLGGIPGDAGGVAGVRNGNFVYAR
jgi:hypothetical protein